MARTRTASSKAKAAAAVKKSTAKRQGAGAAPKAKRTRTLTPAQAANSKLRHSGKVYLHPKTHEYTTSTTAGRKRMMAAHKRNKGRPLSAEHRRKIAISMTKVWASGKRKGGQLSLLGRKGKPATGSRGSAKIKIVNHKANAKLLAEIRASNAAARSAQREKAKTANAKKPAAKKAAVKKPATRKPATKAKSGSGRSRSVARPATL